MSTEKKSEDKTSILISATKYSTIAEFQEDIDALREPPKKNLEKSDEEIKLEEEEAKKKEEENNIKERLLAHWSKLLLKEPPKRRSSHTSFIHDGYFYVIGGIDITEHKQDDIYKVNLQEPNATWTKVDTLGDSLQKIAYHAGAEINGFYYIVGGQNENLKTLNTIQVFDITQEIISEKIELDPEKFPPLESHTVNVDEETNSLIIYGGFSGKELNRHIYSFDVQNKEMKNLTQDLSEENTPPPRQDHAAVIYNKALYIYGGLGLDNKILDDMWKYDFGSNTWTEIKTEAQKNKEDKKKQKQFERENNKENTDKSNLNTELEEDEFEDDDEDEIKDIRPQGRTGHSMVVIGDTFYIFGGKTGLIKESNEIWKFIPEQNDYECVHEVLLEQFTKEELSKISAENKKDEKKFRWLTRSDIEKRTNPSFNSYKSEEEIEKEKERKKKKKQAGEKGQNQQVKKVKMDKNKKTKKTEKKGNKSNNKDIDGKYVDQVLYRPNVLKMRKTLIFTSDSDKIDEGLNALAKDEKGKMNENIQTIKGEIPEPRDGQSACVDGSNIYIFGGDRFKYPFNDLFVLDTVQLPLLPLKENKRLKKEKEKAKEERQKILQKQEEIKEEEQEKEEDKEEEHKEDAGDKNEEKKDEEKKDEEKKEEVNKEEVNKKEEKKEEQKKEEPKKEEVKKKEEKKEEQKKEEPKKEENENKNEEKKEEQKKEEPKKEENENKNEEEEEVLTLREILVYRDNK